MALCRHMPKRSIRSSPLCFQVVRAADGSRRPLPPPMQQDYLSLSDADSWVDTARPRPEDESGLVYAPGGAARGPEKPKFQAFSGGGQILGGGSGQPAMEVLGHGSEAEQLAQAMALSSVRPRVKHFQSPCPSLSRAQGKVPSPEYFLAEPYRDIVGCGVSWVISSHTAAL
eukprot:scaffold206332_cov33-Tisochrysis_lutea.AAC.2